MQRRHFLKQTTFATAGLFVPSAEKKTEHLIFIVICGARKKDYYENAQLAPNIRRLAREGFVFEEDHCERVASHESAFAELLQGRELNSGGCAYPTILDYIGKSVQLDSIDLIPRIMQRLRPRVLVCRQREHEIAHASYGRYLRAVSVSDDAIGRVFNWVKQHPYFSGNTAIVIRPEFGRDDEVNDHGQLHHSFGFYCTHRVASIFWGPDFNRGVDRKTVIDTLDMAPTLARAFRVHPIHMQGRMQGRVVPGLFRTEIAG